MFPINFPKTFASLFTASVTLLEFHHRLRPAEIHFADHVTGFRIHAPPPKCPGTLQCDQCTRGQKQEAVSEIVRASAVRPAGGTSIRSRSATFAKRTQGIFARYRQQR